MGKRKIEKREGVSYDWKFTVKWKLWYVLKVSDIIFITSMTYSQCECNRERERERERVIYRIYISHTNILQANQPIENHYPSNQPITEWNKNVINQWERWLEGH